MNTNVEIMGKMLTLMMVLMLGGSTIYCLYSYIRLRVTYMLFPNRFIYPGNCPPENCIDPDGFIDYILPRVLIFSILLLLCTVGYGLLVIFTTMKSLVVNLAAIVIPVSIFLWYAMVQKKAAKEYWGV